MDRCVARAGEVGALRRRREVEAATEAGVAGVIAVSGTPGSATMVGPPLLGRLRAPPTRPGSTLTDGPSASPQQLRDARWFASPSKRRSSVRPGRRTTAPSATLTQANPVRILPYLDVGASNRCGGPWQHRLRSFDRPQLCMDANNRP